MRTETAEIIEINYEDDSVLESEVKEIKNLRDFRMLTKREGILVAFKNMAPHGVLARENGDTVMVINKTLSQEQQTLVGFHLYCRYIMNTEEMYMVNLPDNYVLLKLFIDLRGHL